MHLVFVSSLVPVADPKSGFDIANRVVVDAIRLAGHKVSVIGFLQPGNRASHADDTRILGPLEVTNSRASLLQKLVWLKDAFAGGEPVSVAKMHRASPADIRAALGAFYPFDGLVLNSVQLPGAFLDLFESYPSIYVAHNVEALSATENAANARSFVSRQLFSREARHLQRLEAELCKRSSHVFTLADADRASLGVAGSGRSSFLPLVTSVAPPPPPAPRETPYDLGLIGSWSWAANRIGLDWFLSEIVPLLPRDFAIAIAGDVGREARRAPGNVSFLGRVADAREFARSCRVIPLVSRGGSGVQLKTIETFELGLPSVATDNALRGIGQRPSNCVGADEAAAFATALRDLVGRSRAGERLDLDGRIFHALQLHGLLAALAQGLDRMARHG